MEQGGAASHARSRPYARNPHRGRLLPRQNRRQGRNEDARRARRLSEAQWAQARLLADGGAARAYASGARQLSARALTAFAGKIKIRADRGGDHMETLPKFGVSRADMMKRVARFTDLKGSDGGLPDSKSPHCERTLYNVIGFQPPDDEGGAVISPVGDDASRLSAIPIS